MRYFCLLVMVLLLGTGAAARDPESPSASSNDERISTELEGLGMETGEIEPLGEDVYEVDILGFSPLSPAISREGRFRPCTVKIRMEGGKVVMERCSLEEAGFRTDPSRLPSSLGIEEYDVRGRHQ